MFLPDDSFMRGQGEPPRRPKKYFIESSKGYPARRDPQAENPTGVMPSQTGKAYDARMRKKYSQHRI